MRLYRAPFLFAPLALAAACGEEAKPIPRIVGIQGALAAGRTPPELEGAWLALGADGEIWGAPGLLHWEGIDPEGHLDPFDKRAPDPRWRVAAHLTELSEASPRAAPPQLPAIGEYPTEPLHLWIHPNADAGDLGAVELLALRPNVQLLDLRLHGLLPEEPISRSLPFTRSHGPFTDADSIELHLHSISEEEFAVIEGRDQVHWRGHLRFDPVPWLPETQVPELAGMRAWLASFSRDLVVRVVVHQGLRWYQIEPVLHSVSKAGFLHWEIVWSGFRQ